MCVQYLKCLTKGTLILLVLLFCSCRNSHQVQSQNTPNTSNIPDLKESKSNTIVFGAQQTSYYLPLLKDKKVAVVANQTSILWSSNGKKVHVVDTLLTQGVSIKKIFAPEHGFRGQQDAGEKVNHGVDQKTGLPIFSLYGSQKKPSKETLKGIDVLVFDIQDVGARFYTYLSTLHYIMEAAAEQQIPVIVFDRPNPNGHYIDGPVLQPNCKSFVGLHPVPIVYGMTIGEYAQMINGERWLKNGIQCDLTVIPLQNYTHTTTYELPVIPSPNLPNAQSIQLYPSLCLFEGTNVSVGRGTDKQFQIYGSPWLPVSDFSFTPVSRTGAVHPKNQGKLCYGKDLRAVKALPSLNLNYLMTAYQQTTQPSKFFNTFFDKLSGNIQLKKQIQQGMDVTSIRQSWQPDLDTFKNIRLEYLLY